MFRPGFSRVTLADRVMRPGRVCDLRAADRDCGLGHGEHFWAELVRKNIATARSIRTEAGGLGSAPWLVIVNSESCMWSSAALLLRPTLRLSSGWPRARVGGHV